MLINSFIYEPQPLIPLIGLHATLYSAFAFSTSESEFSLGYADDAEGKVHQYCIFHITTCMFLHSFLLRDK